MGAGSSADVAMDISIIIPALNEAERIVEAVARALALGPAEVIVADGGSTDETVTRAARAGRVVAAPRGRARQQNAAAKLSRGEVLVFLHADSWLEPGSLDELGRVLTDRRIVAGCFRQCIDASGFSYRILERGNTLRARCWKWAYGDQGIFVRRDVFERVGGFPDVALMEDLYLMKQLKRQGRIRVLQHAIHTSARRWQHTGVIRQTLRNWRLIVQAHRGVAMSRLAQSYRDVR